MVRGSTIDISEKRVRDSEVDVNIHNRFDIEVIDSVTGELKQKAEAYNIIKNNLWTRIFAGSSWFNYIHYGKGAGTPDPTDPGLFDEISNASATGTVVKTFPEDGYAYCRKTIQLGPTTAVGQTITEVGIGFDAGTSSLCTHAMLQDMNGNQISITKTDTDVINIYATIFVHWNPEGYDDGKIKICFPKFRESNVGYGLIPFLLGAYNNSYKTNGNSLKIFEGPVTMDCGEYAGHISSSVSVSSDNRTITYTVSRLGVSDCNLVSGIKHLSIADAISVKRDYYYSQTVAVPGIIIAAPSSGLPGTTITGEAVATGDGTTVDFATKFPFPENSKVYVDGVLAEDAVIDSECPGSTVSVGCFWEFLPERSDIVLPVCLANTNEYTPQSTLTHFGTYWAVFYNKCYKYGLKSINWNDYRFGANIRFEASDDLITWNYVGQSTSFNVPEAYQYCKYWRVRTTSEFEYGVSDFLPNRRYIPIMPSVDDYSKNIHFTTPPPAGSVITIDYFTPVLAKDENHVFDMTITVKLGEYAE